MEKKKMRVYFGGRSSIFPEGKGIINFIVIWTKCVN
jgi:hypothetical protein